jgi:hypothetical protein
MVRTAVNGVVHMSRNNLGMQNKLIPVFILAGFIVFLIPGCQTVAPQMKEADQRYRSGDKKAALAIYERALATAGSKKQKKELEGLAARIRGEITDDTLSAVSRVKQGGENIPVLAKSVRLLQENQTWDDANHRLKTALNESQESLAKLQAEYEKLMDAAKAGESSKAWTPVYQALSRAAQLDPSQGLDTRMAEWVKARDLAFSAAIEGYLGQKLLDKADEEYARLSKELPKPSEQLLASLEAKVEVLRQVELESRLNGLVKKNQYYTAYQLICDAQKPYLKQREPEIRKAGAEFYKGKAQQDFALGGTRVPYGFFAAEKAWQLNPDDEEIFKLRKDLSDLVEANVTQGIAIETFSHPEKEPDAGKEFSNALAAYLKANVPYGVTLLERSKVEDLLKESGQLSITNLASSEFSKVKLFIMGDVTTLTVDHLKDPHQGTTRILLGTERVSNPQYLDCLSRYGNERKKWPEELRDIKPEKEVPKYEKATYNYGNETVEGLMVVAVRTTDTMLGTVKLSSTFNEAFKTQDSYSDELLNADPPIKADALDIPADNTVKQMLHEKLAQKVGAFIIDNSFKNREDIFYRLARSFLERREYEKAVAMLASGYFYCEKDIRYVPKKEDNATFRSIRQAGMFDYTE